MVASGPLPVNPKLHPTRAGLTQIWSGLLDCYGSEMKMARLTDLPGRTLDSKYHLDKLLGQGGMGAVYLATHRD